MKNKENFYKILIYGNGGEPREEKINELQKALNEYKKLVNYFLDKRANLIIELVEYSWNAPAPETIKKATISSK